MSGGLPRDKAYVIAFWLATLLFGVHIVLYILFIWVSRRRSTGAPFLLSFTAAAMLVVGAVQNFVGLERVLTAFWGQSRVTPAEFFNETDIASNYIESVSWLLQVLLGDSFLTYRCWVMYGKRWWAIVPPGVLVIACFCMGMLLQWEYSRDHSHMTNLEASWDLMRWEASMLVLTVLANVSLTVAIAGRIWYQYRQMARTMRRDIHESRHVRIMWMVVESGVLVAIAQVLVLILGGLNNPGYQIVVHAVNPLIGIVFTGVIVRVQLASYSSQLTSGESAPLDTIVMHSAVGAHVHGDPSTLSHRHISFDAKGLTTTNVKRLESHDTGQSQSQNGDYATEELEMASFKGSSH